MITEKILKYLIYFGLAILLYVPFIVAEGMFFPFITGKAYTFRIVTEIIVGLWLILAVLYPVYRPRKSWLLYTFGAFLISLFVSNILGVNPTASFWSNYERMEGWVTIAHLFVLFIALGSVLREKKEWVWLFNASIVVSLFMVSSAFAQIFESGFNARVDTTLGNSTYLGIYMLIHAFLSLFLLLRRNLDSNFLTSWPIYFYGISFVLQVIVLFQTGTRGSMLGLLGGLVLMGLLMTFLNKGNKALRKIALSAIGVIAIFIATIFIFKDSALVQNIQPLNRITTISINEGTAQARIINWQIATEGVKERPILGWGQSNFNYVFDKHYPPEHYGNENWFDRVHNIFFDWLIAGGILGLFFYLSIWVALVLIIFRADKFSPNEKSVLIALLAGYFFHNLFVFDQIVSYIYFAFILAFVYSQTGTEIPALMKKMEERTEMLLVSLLVILIFVTPYFINYQSYSANKELIKALVWTKQNSDGRVMFNYEDGLYSNINYHKQALSRGTFGNPEITERIVTMGNEIIRVQNLDEKMKNDYINFAIAEAQKLIVNDPANSRYPYLFGSFLAQIGQVEMAEKHLLQAIKLSPNKQALRMQLVRVYLGTDQLNKALGLAKETYELDTSKDDPWIEYARVASKANKELFSSLIDEAFSKGEIKKIEKLLVSNVANNPENIQTRISLSAFYHRVGNIGASLKVLDDALKDFPDAQQQINSLKAEIQAGSNPTGQKF